VSGHIGVVVVMVVEVEVLLCRRGGDRTPVASMQWGQSRFVSLSGQAKSTTVKVKSTDAIA
jgi:hypothetical protein